MAQSCPADSHCGLRQYHTTKGMVNLQRYYKQQTGEQITPNTVRASLVLKMQHDLSVNILQVER